MTEVQKEFGKRYNLSKEELNPMGKQFDVLMHDDMKWKLGQDIDCSVISTPGHTPACMSYRIGDAAFVGDTLFMVYNYICFLLPFFTNTNIARYWYRQMRFPWW